MSTPVSRNPEHVAIDTLRAVARQDVVEIINRMVVERVHAVLYCLERGGDAYDNGPVMNLFRGLSDEERDSFCRRINALSEQLVERDLYMMATEGLPAWVFAATKDRRPQRGRRTKFRSLADWRRYHDLTPLLPLDPADANFAMRRAALEEEALMITDDELRAFIGAESLEEPTE
jgi:hypothetical protein